MWTLSREPTGCTTRYILPVLKPGPVKPHCRELMAGLDWGCPKCNIYKGWTVYKKSSAAREGLLEVWYHLTYFLNDARSGSMAAVDCKLPSLALPLLHFILRGGTFQDLECTQSVHSHLDPCTLRSKLSGRWIRSRTPLAHSWLVPPKECLEIVKTSPTCVGLCMYVCKLCSVMVRRRRRGEKFMSFDHRRGG
jgi:hypothetical protein